MKCLTIILSILILSCTTTDSKRVTSAVLVKEIDEKIVKAAALNVVATGIALKTAPMTNVSVRVAAEFNDKAATLLPAPSFADIKFYTEIVAGLTSENQKDRERAKELLDGKDSEIVALQSERNREAVKLAALENKLIEMGGEYEKEKNKSWWTRIYATLGFGGIIALCIAFPVAIPIAGNLLGSLISTVPSLASAFGLVSRKAFDSVVTGVQKAKEKMKNGGNWNNSQILSDELERATDKSHRNLIASRKQNLYI